MYQSKVPLKIAYSMTTTPGAPQTPKSRGVSLFDRQAQLHAYDSEQSISTLRDPPSLSVLRPVQSLTVAPPPVVARSTSPRVIHQRLVAPLPNKLTTSEALQETDFPLEEASGPLLNPTSSLCCATVEQAFNYLEKHDDDDDVINVRDDQYDRYDVENENPSDGDDSVDTIDLDAATIHSRPSTNDGSSGIGSDQRHDSVEKLTDYPTTTQMIPGGPASEDNDSSDIENQSHEDEMDHDDEPLKEDQFRQQIEQEKQLIIRQQKIMWSIEQEWIRKEKTIVEELEKLGQNVNGIPAANFLLVLIQNLLRQHRKVQREVELLCDRDQQPSNLLRQLTQAINTLMQTLQFYDEYIQENLSPLRKALEKRPLSNAPSTEDLLSVLPKQFLQILSQVQDLHKTAQSFDSDDRESLRQLYEFAHKCKLFGSRQDENINKVILKDEDVAIQTSRGTRDRCRIILYPDALVGSILKTSLLTSPKYTLIWFIPVIELAWTIPSTTNKDPVETGDDLKSNLKSAYQELEKAPSITAASSRLRKIRKQENEYNLAQSNLPLNFSNSSSSRQNGHFTILFSSAYQRQDWIDLLEKTKQELIQRSSTFLDPVNTHHQRLTENLIQKRLEFIKPPSQDSTTSENSSTSPTNKTYSGTLHITIYSLQGLALSNPTRSVTPLTPTDPEKYQFYVAVEIDSYNTFNPYAQTAKRPMQNNDTVEFRGEAFQVELEYSQAFRLLVYRLDTSDTQNRAQCIGKFHRNIESGLRDCERQLSGILPIELPNGDLKLKISLKHAKRDGTFRRQPSKRNKAIFGKSIESLMNTSNGSVDGIPRIIFKCIEMVDREGLEETGIYRVCCVTSDLQKLRSEFDRQPLRAEELLTSKSVHVAANLLKLFFRELPEPLFTSSLYRQFVHATQLTDVDNQRVTLLKTFEILHPDNRRILLYLLDHLLRVSQYSHINMMHLENLAVVFGPTLMRPSKLISPTYFSVQGQPLSSSHLDLASESDQMSTELQGSMHQCQVVLAYLKLRRDGLLK